MDIVPEIQAKVANLTSLFEVEERVVREVLQFAQVVMGWYLEKLDEQLLAEKDAGWRCVNRQERTVNFTFGPVTFKRRYYYDEKGQGHFLLDERLKLAGRKRISPFLRMAIAKVAQVTTMRNTADVINLLFNAGVSTNAVMTAVHELGPKVATQSQVNEQKPVERRIPQNLVLEGDATPIKIKGRGEARPLLAKRPPLPGL
ncbi:UPF0236 family transposase-like protein [Limosilactobacillus reuteri]|uniref:UPF0236 family transposase-like protein n=1 Tax=Limosilactobacillus reuteri TaxID=1598 RepID=UPI00227130C7|nr:UPF0236 family protein [Limosilactobacillus reuteri]